MSSLPLALSSFLTMLPATTIVVSRCVRRAWLCGIDPYSNIDCSHRKAWVEQRLHDVAACFAIGIYGYAVMSNHLHIVVHVDIDAAQRWSDDEVAQRWCQLFPSRVQDHALRLQTLHKNPPRLALLDNACVHCHG